MEDHHFSRKVKDVDFINYELGFYFLSNLRQIGHLFESYENDEDDTHEKIVI